MKTAMASYAMDDLAAMHSTARLAAACGSDARRNGRGHVPELEPELGPDCGGLVEWPVENVVKLLCFYHPDDSDDVKAQQEATVKRLFTAARRNRLEFLLEIIPSKVAPSMI